MEHSTAQYKIITNKQEQVNIINFLPIVINYLVLFSKKLLYASSFKSKILHLVFFV